MPAKSSRNNIEIPLVACLMYQCGGLFVQVPYNTSLPCSKICLTTHIMEGFSVTSHTRTLPPFTQHTYTTQVFAPDTSKHHGNLPQHSRLFTTMFSLDSAEQCIIIFLLGDIPGT